MSCNCDDIIIEIPTEEIIIEVTPEGKDGNGIASIELLSTVGRVKTYRIHFTNGTHYDYQVSDGAQGDPGPAATIAVGTVTTLPAGSPATVENVGTSSAARFNFGIPQGEQGEPGASSWGDITGDIADQADLQAALNSKADIIHSTASGSIVSIADGAPLPVDSLVVAVEPVQDLHGYANPWPAGGGVNICPKTEKVKIDNGIYADPDGTHWGCADHILATPGAVYYGALFYANAGSSANIIFHFRDSNGTLVGDYTVSGNTGATAPADSAYFQIRTSANISTAGNNVKLLVSVGSAQTTYSPYANVCPISGWTQADIMRDGVNLLPITATGNASSASCIITTNADGSVTINGTSTSTPVAWLSKSGYFKDGTVNDTFYFAPGEYYLQAGSSSPTFWVNLYNVDTNSWVNIGVGKRTLGGNYKIRVSGTNGVTYNNLTIYPMIVLNSDANASFEKYKGISLTIPFGQTVYGATLDVLTGVMTVTKVLVDGGSYSWRKNGEYSQFRTSSAIDGVNDTLGGTIISSVYKSGKAYDRLDDKSVCVNSYIWVYDTSYTSESDFNSAMSGVKFCYELATPITVTLTPQQMSLLLGQNAVWCSTGDTQLGYRADTRRYIDQHIAQTALATRSMITGVEAQMKATKNYTSGSLIIVGDDLLKATSNIANGASLTIGTNVAKVTLAEYILSVI